MKAMNFEAALISDEKGTILRIYVVPNAKEYLIQYDEWRKEFKVKVKAPPREGKANQDVLQFLSRYFKKPLIVSGDTSHSKKIRVENGLQETSQILGEILT